MRTYGFRLAAWICIGCVFVAPALAANADDKKIVGDLDTQYQLAVKNNDAKTMDRILADDFVLVTGRGRAFTKADLLKDTQANVVYEYREIPMEAVVGVMCAGGAVLLVGVWLIVRRLTKPHR